MKKKIMNGQLKNIQMQIGNDTPITENLSPDGAST